ncbi:hypothetical protein [Streptomyces fulvorobeus]|nr:hypothetical protein [Streptomyces fulvorobeus]NYE44254.1 hypothetical protein [Streptomyces fulvorobeus]
MFNIFVDSNGHNVATFHTEEAYDASALANHFVDAGYSVDTDLWDATVADAMMSPEVAALAEATLPLVSA